MGPGLEEPPVIFSGSTGNSTFPEPGSSRGTLEVGAGLFPELHTGRVLPIAPHRNGKMDRLGQAFKRGSGPREYERVAHGPSGEHDSGDARPARTAGQDVHGRGSGIQVAGGYHRYPDCGGQGIECGPECFARITLFPGARVQRQR